MLALFALGITPKILLHTLVAHHTDSHPVKGHDGTDRYNKAGFHCDCESLVVESPFLDQKISIELGIPSAYPVCQSVIENNFPPSPFFIVGLRGPPAIFSIS
jgi:hypothetical protein